MAAFKTVADLLQAKLEQNHVLPHNFKSSPSSPGESKTDVTDVPSHWVLIKQGEDPIGMSMKEMKNGLSDGTLEESTFVCIFGGTSTSDWVPIFTACFSQYDVDPSKIHYVKSGADLREEFLKMIAAGKTCMVLGEGQYTYSESLLVLKKPTKIYGQGRGKTTLVGFGLKIQGKKSDGIVEIEDLTIKGAQYGLRAERGMNVIMTRCSVEDCQWNGVFARGADVSCNDLQVVGCGKSGVLACNYATITLIGQGTSIQGNGTKGESNYYGLDADSDSNIQLVVPLTKEEISTKNGGGGNWGGDGKIEQVEDDAHEEGGADY